MEITTSEELKKQLSVIFGYKTGLIQPEIEIGDIIRIGKQSARKTEILIKKVLQFLYAYNAMLQDYAGCTLHSIEFDLENLDKTSESLHLLPKSMLFIPDEYKENVSFTLLLMPEMELLDISKAKDALHLLSKRFFEIEEASDRPELTRDKQIKFLSKFAHRFALRLQGEVIEGKWQKKLVGLKGKEFLEGFEPYIKGTIEKDMDWATRTILARSFRLQFPLSRLGEKIRYEALKYIFLPEILETIIRNTYQLSSKLFSIANTGTVNDLQNQLIIMMIQAAIRRFELKNDDTIDLEKIPEKMDELLDLITKILDKVHVLSLEFCGLGIQNEKEFLVNQYIQRIRDKMGELKVSESGISDKFISALMDDYLKIVENQLMEGNYTNSDKVRSMEFKPIFIYIRETLKIVIKKIKISLPKYLKSYALMKYAGKLLNMVYDEFKDKRKPIKTLGVRYLEKFSEYLRQKIAEVIEKDEEIDKDEFTLFKSICNRIMENFIDEIKIEVSDLMGFVEIMHENDPVLLEQIRKLQNLSGEVRFIWKLMLRASVLQNFLRELDANFDKDEPVSPRELVGLYSEFVSKRLSAFPMDWKDLVFSWLQEFIDLYDISFEVDKKDGRPWHRIKIIEMLIEFIGKKVNVLNTIEGFREFLVNYLEDLIKNAPSEEAYKYRYLPEIVKSYDMSIELIEQIPEFIHQVFATSLENITPVHFKESLENFRGHVPTLDTILKDFEAEIKEMSLEMLTQPKHLGSRGSFRELIDERFKPSTFYQYLTEFELKYFSKLYARPIRIILKNMKDPNGGEYGSLIHVITLKMFKNFIRVEVSTNLEKIKAFVQNYYK